MNRRDFLKIGAVLTAGTVGACGPQVTSSESSSKFPTSIEQARNDPALRQEYLTQFMSLMSPDSNVRQIIYINPESPEFSKYREMLINPNQKLNSTLAKTLPYPDEAISDSSIEYSQREFLEDMLAQKERPIKSDILVFPLFFEDKCGGYCNGNDDDAEAVIVGHEQAQAYQISHFQEENGHLKRKFLRRFFQEQSRDLESYLQLYANFRELQYADEKGLNLSDTNRNQAETVYYFDFLHFARKYNFGVTEQEKNEGEEVVTDLFHPMLYIYKRCEEVPFIGGCWTKKVLNLEDEQLLIYDDENNEWLKLPPSLIINGTYQNNLSIVGRELVNEIGKMLGAPYQLPLKRSNSTTLFSKVALNIDAEILPQRV